MDGVLGWWLGLILTGLLWLWICLVISIWFSVASGVAWFFFQVLFGVGAFLGALIFKDAEPPIFLSLLYLSLAGIGVAFPLWALIMNLLCPIAVFFLSFSVGLLPGFGAESTSMSP